MKKIFDIIGIALLAKIAIDFFRGGKPVYGCILLLLVVGWAYTTYFSASARTQRAAKNGDCDAQYEVGLWYYLGMAGLKQNHDKAMEWWTKAAEQGHTAAAGMLGCSYLFEKSETRDSALGMKWMRVAAQGGDASAQYLMGLGCYLGYGEEPKDLQEALMWWGKSCAVGESAFFLARAHLLGEGTRQDEAEAARLLEYAAAKGYEPARTLLAALRKSPGQAADLAREEMKPTARDLLAFLDKDDDEAEGGAPDLGDDTPPACPRLGDKADPDRAPGGMPDPDVNHRGFHGVTPLMLAADEGREKKLHALLAAGADPNLHDDDGYTALFYAVQKGNAECVRLLLDAGAAVDATNGPSSVTALMLASLDGRTRLVEMLIAAGANVDARSSDETTALMAAAEAGQPAAVKCLLAAGADPALVGPDGITALSLAEKRKHRDIAAMLREAATPQ